MHATYCHLPTRSLQSPSSAGFSPVRASTGRRGTRNPSAQLPGQPRFEPFAGDAQTFLEPRPWLPSEHRPARRRPGTPPLTTVSRRPPGTGPGGLLLCLRGDDWMVTDPTWIWRDCEHCGTPFGQSDDPAASAASAPAPAAPAPTAPVNTAKSKPTPTEPVSVPAKTAKSRPATPTTTPGGVPRALSAPAALVARQP